MASVDRSRSRSRIGQCSNGLRVGKPIRADSERIARNKVGQIEHELPTGNLPEASRLPLSALLDAFCGHLRTQQTHNSYRKDVSRLRNVFGEVCEALKIRPPGSLNRHRAKLWPDRYVGDHIKADILDDVTPVVINRFLDSRIRRARWAAKTANGIREILHRLFAYAIKHHGFCSGDRQYPNPAAGVDRHREPAPEIRFLTLCQIEQQLAALADHPVIRAIVATCIYAGLRREEVAWLTHEDVDLASRLIRVRAKTIGGRSWQPKTRRNRVVPISGALMGILREYQPPRGSVWFYTSPGGKKWDPDNLSHSLRNLNRAKALVWSCGDFRHTFGSQLAQKGESLYKIAMLMGNSPDICRRHYAALIPEEMHETVEFAKPTGDVDPSQATTRQLLEEVLNRMDQAETQPDGCRCRGVGNGQKTRGRPIGK